MVSSTLHFALLGLLQGVAARTLPSKVQIMSHTSNVRQFAVAAPAMPTSTLVSDFKKNNVSASWAEGYPKQWGTEEVRYNNIISISPDEKFVAVLDGSHAKVSPFGSNTTVADIKFDFPGDLGGIIFLSNPAGGYDLFVTASNYSASTDVTLQSKLSANGTATSDKQIQYEGQWSNIDNAPFNKDHRKLITLRMDYGLKKSPVYVYNLDDPSKNLTLTGHTDWTMSTAFSPDGKYISTAAWDGTGKIWDANTGALLRTFGPFTTTTRTNYTYTQQNWLTNFSPDGKYLLLESGGGSTTFVNIYPVAGLADSTAQLTPVAHITGFTNWVRDSAWSPDSSLLAVGEYGLILVYDAATWTLVQRWEMEDRSNWEISDLTWFDGNNKLAYRTTGGLEMYDFVKNLKYRWGPGDYDHFNYGSSGTWWLKTKGWIGGIDSDEKTRFWKAPA